MLLPLNTNFKEDSRICYHEAREGKSQVQPLRENMLGWFIFIFYNWIFTIWKKSSIGGSSQVYPTVRNNLQNQELRF